MNRTPLFIAALAAAALATPPCAAQHADAFSTVGISAGASADVYDRSDFRRYWQPGTGGTATVETPFYAGYAELGLAYQRYEKRANVPGYTALWAFAGWGLDARLSRRVRWRNGLRIGDVHMSFDAHANQYASTWNENELTLGVLSQLRVSAGRGWSLFAGGSVSRTYTAVPLHSVQATGGISYSFRSPRWLSGFLR